MHKKTDFICEEATVIDNNQNCIKDREEYSYCTLQKFILNEKHEETKTAKGTYFSILFHSLEEDKAQEEITELIRKCLSYFFDLYHLDHASCFVVGLGNAYVTCDKLGNETIRKIIVTKHLKDDTYTQTIALSPGVMGQTGMDTSEIIKSIQENEKMDFLIVIDALASSRINRLNRMIQISDIGIQPGSATSNERKPITMENLHVPVLVIGIATVVSTYTLLSTLIDELKIDSDKKDEILSLYEKENCIVTPKDCEKDIEILSSIVAKSINQVLHPQLFS